MRDSSHIFDRHLGNKSCLQVRGQPETRDEVRSTAVVFFGRMKDHIIRRRMWLVTLIPFVFSFKFHFCLTKSDSRD